LIGLLEGLASNSKEAHETYHENNKIEFFRHLGSSAKKSSKGLLTFREFTTAQVVGTIKSHDTVNHEETVFIGREVDGKTFQQFSLHLFVFSNQLGLNCQMWPYFAVLGTSIGDVLAGLIGVD